MNNQLIHTRFGQSGDDPPLAPAEREGDPQRDEGVKELTIGFRRLAEELQMQMGRVERRLEDLEEDVRSLKVQVKEKEEQPRLSSCVTSVTTLEKRMDGMQEMMRSLEDGLRSWQSRTQQLDRWHQDHRSCTVTAPVTAPVAGATAGAAADATETETTETSVALGSSPARPLSPRMNEVKVTEHRDGDSPRHLRTSRCRQLRQQWDGHHCVLLEVHVASTSLFALGQRCHERWRHT